jgi:serine/threonine protein phosphatase 1
MKVRVLAISDIHGTYDEFLALLSLVKYDPSKDQLILVGDYVDRGLKSKDVINKIIKLVENGAIALKGNHDDMFLRWLKFGDGLNFFHNGGFSTVTSYVGYDFFEAGYDEVKVQEARSFILNHYPHHIKFLEDLLFYHEQDGHVFVHAGINPHLKDWKYSTTEDYIWIRDQFLNNNHEHSETFVHGHTPTIHLHQSPDIFFGNKKIGIDGACAYGGQLNCLEIMNGEYKQYQVKKNKG